MNCPSCHGAMEPLSFQSHLGTPLEIDACWGCQLIWFDSMESTALAPQSVVDLFRRIYAARDVSRNIVAMKPACPRCNDLLGLTRDMTARGGSFSYHRCLNGHGRLISFTQFLREKNFIRSLNPLEIQKLSVSIKQIRCSSCGASVDLTHDTSCTHCGSAIAVLDHDAVEKALTALQAQQAKQLGATAEQRANLEVALERIRETPSYRGHRQAAPIDSLDWLVAGGVLITAAGSGSGSDLVDVGIGALVALFD